MRGLLLRLNFLNLEPLNLIFLSVWPNPPACRSSDTFRHFLPMGPHNPLHDHLSDALAALDHHRFGAEIDRDELNLTPVIRIDGSRTVQPSSIPCLEQDHCAAGFEPHSPPEARWQLRSGISARSMGANVQFALAYPHTGPYRRSHSSYKPAAAISLGLWGRTRLISNSDSSTGTRAARPKGARR